MSRRKSQLDVARQTSGIADTIKEEYKKAKEAGDEARMTQLQKRLQRTLQKSSDYQFNQKSYMKSSLDYQKQNPERGGNSSPYAPLVRSARTDNSNADRYVGKEDARKIRERNRRDARREAAEMLGAKAIGSAG